MNKYAKFFAIAQQLPHFGNAERAALALETSNGRTSSLTQLTDSEYKQILETMQTLLKTTTTSRNRWSKANISNCRKLVIAAIGGYFRLIGKDSQDINTILGTACRHAATKSGFNSIPVDQLHRIYNTFTAKQRDCHRAIIKANTMGDEEPS